MQTLISDHSGEPLRHTLGTCCAVLGPSHMGIFAERLAQHLAHQHTILNTNQKNPLKALKEPNGCPSQITGQSLRILERIVQEQMRNPYETFKETLGESFGSPSINGLLKFGPQWYLQHALNDVFVVHHGSSSDDTRIHSHPLLH